MRRTDDIVLAHSSDIHVDDALVPGAYCGLTGLARVLATAAAFAADAVLLAGDTFDNHRVSDGVLARAHALLAGAGRPVVLLPGNHDPAIEPCLFRRAGLLELPNVRVIGLNDTKPRLDGLDLEIVGQPHLGFSDFPPVARAAPRWTRWRIVMAHGHYVPPGDEAAQAHRAWRFDDRMLAESDADYVALGHWDRALKVGPGGTAAFYSGSPDLALTLNLVRLHPADGVRVTRETFVDPG